MDGFVLNSLLLTLAGTLGFQWMCFAVAALLQTEKFYDGAGSINFVLLAYYTYTAGLTRHSSVRDWRGAVVTALLVLWAFRLGTFLVVRVLKHGKDSRFDKVKINPAKFFVYWTVQAAWVWLTSLPVTLLNVTDSPASQARWTDVVGLSLWVIGFALEVTADVQKYQFGLQPTNKGRWIDEGVWRYSRHPNYAGDIMQWWGVFLISFAGLSSIAELCLSLVSPVFITYLLTSVSGIPILEKTARNKWGTNPKFQVYKLCTSPLLPLPRLSETPEVTAAAEAAAQEAVRAKALYEARKRERAEKNDAAH